MTDYTFSDKRELVKLRRFVANLVLVGMVFLMGACVKTLVVEGIACRTAVANDDSDGINDHCID